MAQISATDEKLLRSALPLLRSVELALPGRPSLFYREAGPSDGEPLVLLHGLGSSAGEFRGQFAGLKDRFRVIAWNGPGFGGSSPVASDDPGAADYVAVLGALLDALGLDRVTLVGCSWGTVVAACFAAANPGRVKSLVMLSPNTAFGHLTGEDRQGAIAQWLDPDLVLAAEPRSLAGMLAAPDAPDLVQSLIGALPESITERGFEGAVRMMSNVETVKVLDGVKVPMLVIAGDQDRLAPVDQHGRPIAGAVPGTEVKLLPGVGHMVDLEAPMQINQEIARFVDAQR